MLYLRQSTYREESISLEVQEHSAREHCARQGYEVVRVEADPGISGRSWKQRKGVQAALGAIEAGEADVIVVWRWSRLSRSRRDWAVAADQADLAGGRIESATEPNDQTAAGRFARGVMTELAAFESERIGEQWSEARAHRVARGLPSTGGPRFGYRIVDRAYVPDPVTGPVLAELYALYLGGQGSSQLTRMLNDRGIPHGRTEGRRWAYQDTLRVLDAGFAAGLLVKTAPRPRGQSNVGQKHLPVWEREFRPGAHEPLIDRATWDAYVAARRARTKTRVRRGAPMLSGLLVCLDCGGPMHGNTYQGRQLYVCSRGSTFSGHRQVSIFGSMIEPGVEAWLFEMADDLSTRAAAVEQTAAHAERVDMTARRAQQQLAKIDERLLQLTLRLADGTITESAYRLAAEALEVERADATDRLHRSRRNPVREAAPAGVSRDLVRQWPSMTSEVRNAVLRPLIARIEVRPALHRGERAQRWRIVPAFEADVEADSQ
ncbi:hypothetical protein A9Z40_02935 [Microbacterium arborescens]|uniref:Recombinase family protein n=1 Tax=Microbacterium arborescens TaxID=33883 RepID=A0ABX2WIK8_9MICO|nr:hypothetical protein A9Z40_02935 [Microbacterium arborescens]